MDVTLPEPSFDLPPPDPPSFDLPPPDPPSVATATATKKRKRKEKGDDADEPKAKKKKITSQACKAKGRRFQQEVERALKHTFPHLKGNDIRSISMGCQGADLILSTAALKVLPYDFEMKNQENLQLWAAIRQCTRRVDAETDTDIYPMLVIRRNRTKPLAIMPLGHYCYLRAGRRPVYALDHMCTARGILGHFDIEPRTHAKEAPAVNLANAAAAVFGASFGRPHAFLIDEAFSALEGPDSLAVSFHAKATLNIWKEHDRATPLVFNRGDLDMCMFIAVPFQHFLDIVKT